MTADEEKKTDEQTTQPSLIDPQPFEIGSYQVAGDRGGKVKRYSKDGNRICLSHTLTDGHKSEVWYDLPEIAGYEDKHPQPGTGDEDTVGAQPDVPHNKIETKTASFLSDTEKLQKEIYSLEAQLKQVEQQRDEEDIAKQSAQFKLRQALAKQTTEAKEESEISATFGELKAAQDEIVKLTARVFELENPPVQQRPLVEVKKLSREIAFDSVAQDDIELATWLAEGYEIIPALSKITFINNTTGSEHITFKRTNRQPIQPHYPQPSDSLAEINRAFDAQAIRDNPIISQAPSKTPYTDLLRQGYEANEIKQACDGQAFEKACASFKESKSKQHQILIEGGH